MVGLNNLLNVWSVGFNENSDTLIVLPANSYSGLLLERIFFRASNLDGTTYILLTQYQDKSKVLLKENYLGFTLEDVEHKTIYNALMNRYGGKSEKVKMIHLEDGIYMEDANRGNGTLTNYVMNGLRNRREGLGLLQSGQVDNVLIIEEPRHLLANELLSQFELALKSVEESVGFEDIDLNILGVKVGYNSGNVKITAKDMLNGDLDRRGGFTPNFSGSTLQDDLNCVNGVFTIYNNWVSKSNIKYKEMEINAVTQTIKRGIGND